MKITTLTINVAGGTGNRAVVLDVFSFVDVVFIVDPPLRSDGSLVPHEGNVDKELFSFVVGSGVEVFVRSALVELFDVVRHDVDGVTVGFVNRGKRFLMRGIYVRPGRSRRDWDGFVANWDGCDVIMGDFNARHPS